MRKNETLLKKLWHHWPAKVALVIIASIFLIALAAYVIAPDRSPNANNMVVELSARPVGFKMQFLLLPKNDIAVSSTSFQSVLTGKQEKFHYLPINGYELQGDTLRVRHYIDQGLEDTLAYTLAELQMPLDVLQSPASLKVKWISSHKVKEKKFYLGTDRYGRDILSRLIIGARVSVAVGIVSVSLSISIGILLGALAGWYGGFLDDLIMWLINILWSVPTLLLVFAITLTIGKGFWEIFIAIGLTSWVTAARLIRGQVMQLKEMDFVVAAQSVGLRDGRIIWRHVLPNIIGPVMVIASANFATAILVEAGLSFLGVGVQPPTPSWGLMIKEHYTFLITGNPVPALIPGLAIMVLVLAFNILGNALRDVVDVR